MNYTKIYDSLILNRINNHLTNGYIERHHIFPLSMGGSNSKENIVYLTAREHFIAHRLLFKIHKNRQMAYALNLMCNTKNENQKRIYISSRKYESIRQNFSKSISKENHHFFGKKRSDSTKKKISKKVSKSLIGNKRALGFKHTTEHKEKVSKFFKGRKRTDEEKQKIKENQPNIKGIKIHFNNKTYSFCSSSDASEWVGTSSSNIRMWCRKRHTISRGKNKGMRFEYGH